LTSDKNLIGLLLMSRLEMVALYLSIPVDGVKFANLPANEKPAGVA
jgi:hypothetical protein